jgi:hypothetical protein
MVESVVKMKSIKYLLASGTIALGMAVAASGYHLTISNPTWVNGNELKPGDYRVQVEGDKVMIKNRDTDVETSAKMQTADKKFPVTSVRSDNVNGQQQLKEIDFGGSKTAIVFQAGPNGASGQ